MTDLFITCTAVAAWLVLMTALGYVVGRDREREAQVVRTAQQVARIRRQPMSDLDQLLVDGGSLRAAERERRM